MKPEDRTWYYLGCTTGVGHRLVDGQGRNHYHDDLIQFDGQLCPEDPRPYRALLTRLPKLGYTALAWWDKTVDTRPGSNSIIFAPSPTCNLESIRFNMREWFQWVEARLPQPLVILEGEMIYDGKRTRNR